LLHGVDTLWDAVKSTLGPKACTCTVLIKKSFGPTRISNDGVTVAKSIDLEAPIESMGPRLSAQRRPRPAIPQPATLI
jgi:chaperonin GroEL